MDAKLTEPEPKKMTSPEKVAVEEEIPGDSTLFAKLSSKEELEQKKWMINLKFIIGLLAAMGAVYAVDILLLLFTPVNLSESIRDQFLEVLKTVLFMASGYVYARTENKHNSSS